MSGLSSDDKLGSHQRPSRRWERHHSDELLDKASSFPYRFKEVTQIRLAMLPRGRELECRFMISFPKTTAQAHTLDNGLTVLLDPNPSHPVVSAQVWVETGSMHEGDYLGAGVSHLLEHMVFKGTEKYSGDSLASFVQSKGGQWNAYTSFDRTVYYIDGPSESTEDFVDVLHQLVFKPLFPKYEFEKEKQVIHREMAMGDDDVDSQFSKLLFKTVYSEDSRKFPVIGFKDSFDQVSHEDLWQYYRERYIPENTFLVLSGDFEASEVLSFLEKNFGSVPRRWVKPVVLSEEPLQMGERNTVLPFDTPNAKLSLAWQIGNMSSELVAEIDLLANLIGNGRTSILYRRLREELELCYGISAYAWQPKEGRGFFSISAVCKPEDIDRLKVEILKTIQQLDPELSQANIKKAVRQELINQLDTLTSTSGRASDLGSNWNQARNLDFTKLYLEKIQKVTPEGLKKASDYIFEKERLNDVRVMPKESLTEATQVRSVDHTKSVAERIEEVELSNGIKVALYQDDKLPSIQLTATWLGGLLAETPENNGINSLIASILTQGAGPLNSEAFSTKKEELGISITSASGNNTSSLYLSTLNDVWGEALELFKYVLSDPHFDSTVLERERETKLAVLAQSKLDPVSEAFFVAKSHLFEGSSYALKSIGSEGSLANLTQGHLKAHYETFYINAAPSVAVVGDFDRESIVEELETLFAHYKEAKPKELEVKTSPKFGEFELRLPREQAVLVRAYPSLGVDAENLLELELLQEYLGDMAGPLFSKIREELGLVYFVNVNQFQGLGKGMFAYYLGTSEEQLPLAIQSLDEEIQRLMSEALSNEVLENIKASWASSFLLSQQSSGSIANTCALSMALGKKIEENFAKVEKIKSITTKDILSLSKQLFSQDFVEVKVLPET